MAIHEYSKADGGIARRIVANFSKLKRKGQMNPAQFGPSKEQISLPAYEVASADHNDVGELLEGLEGSLKKLGVYMYEDPFFEGSDMYGVILCKQPLTPEQIKAISSDAFGQEPDPDEVPEEEEDEFDKRPPEPFPFPKSFRALPVQPLRGRPT
jgi:hypothetical protein